jgi:hypothetical protein
MGGVCGACGAAYLNPVAELPAAPVGTCGGTKLVVSGVAEVGEMVEIGMGSGM